MAKADEIEKLSAARYREEMNSLRVFHDKWQAHYNKLLDKYPDDEGLRAVEKFNSDMNDIFSGGTSAIKEIEKQFESEKARLESVSASGAEEKPKKAAKTLAEDAVSKSGFSFEEAWNPTDDLGQIMKDLGLVSEEK